MRSSHLVIVAGMLVAACATPTTKTETFSVAPWDGRDISELVALIGPFDTTTARGDARTYDWFRFSNCKVTAHTTPDNKIVKVDMAGSTQGCSPYAEKLGAK